MVSEVVVEAEALSRISSRGFSDIIIYFWINSVWLKMIFEYCILIYW